VVGDGDEIASLRMRIEPGQETRLMPMGPTLTFREIHDQLVIADENGEPSQARNNLFQKLWPSAFPLSTWGGVALITLACLCFFVGATGKSAQFPLYTWLPDAMAGPTPVSALIHAATMVTAGVYMIARLNFLFSLSARASATVAVIGAFTALFAASIGFFQYDIKKVLAYSTVSQLGFMFIGAGVGAYWAAIFHLVTHAFFKACLFLGSGSVIHGMHAVEHDADAAQDMRNMGGLRRVMPWTARTYFVACLAITAAPIPLLAGFWSKDEILWKAFNNANTGSIPGPAIWAAGLGAAFCTSFYMWRSYYLTFTGKHAKKAIAKKVKESPAAMTWVLWALAGLSTVAGVILGFSMHYLGGHGEPLLESWLHPTLAHSAARFDKGGLGLEYALMALSVGGAIAMWLWARRRYGPHRSAQWSSTSASPGCCGARPRAWSASTCSRCCTTSTTWTRSTTAASSRPCTGCACGWRRWIAGSSTAWSMRRGCSPRPVRGWSACTTSTWWTAR
jgi:NADH-quinone oxidoreductase subunit L